ncbi:MAG TPA: hypothetical protein VFL87_06795 [Thermoleophilaceae bacterium]|nr:hypothetical protein [Thermoleophilaceae bacterium]
MSFRTLKEHQTTLRFTAEMWDELVAAASALDVSVAQYVRDAARVRLERDAARVRLEHDARAPSRPKRNRDEGAAAREVSREEAANAREVSLGEAESTAAVWEQGRLARERARLIRQEASRLRELGPRVRGRLTHPSVTRATSPWEAGRVARERLNLAPPQEQPREPRPR